MVFFYAAVSLAGAFSGLLAYAIQKMDGVAGLQGWRWSVSISQMNNGLNNYTAKIDM